ncbi:MAG: ATP-dependent Clp protease ATP-binding subunit [Bacilli bacterium]|nr:ATP-dependent Clp protease ATP-binding subunit [Bacilli bacterium]
MNLFFDEMSQKLIINAKKEMYELKHPYVGSEHLLLAILHENLDITKTLNNFNVTYDKFKQELVNTVGIGSKENTWFLFTPLLRRIINNATYYSRDNNKMVTPYNLLVSILQEGDGVANRILLGMNIEMNKLCEKFLSNEYMQSSNNKKTILDELGVNMNECARLGKYDPVIGRENEINRVIQILLRKNKNNPLLIGEAGVGKTAIVEELAKKINIGDVPYKLKDKIIYSISMSVLVAGTKYRGEFEEKINRLLDEVKNNSNIILFIDEVHTLMGAGGAEGAIDASNIVKPFLARGDIKVIGATTLEEYFKFIDKDKALDRRFQKIYIKEPGKESVKNILYKLKDVYENYHNVILKKRILNKIVDYSFDSIFNGRQPDKAIDLLDEVCSYAAIANSVNQKLVNYEIKINEIEEKKNHEIKLHNFKKALMLKNREMNLRSEYNNYLLNFSNNEKVVITNEIIKDVIYNKNRIIKRNEYLERINTAKKDCTCSKLDLLFDVLEKYEYIENNKPFTILLISKNVSKELLLVDKVIKNIFDGSNYINIDMNEFKDYSSISRLIGGASGYIGSLDNYVFQSIKENPFTILFFKNIDKAHPRIIKLLFNGISNGYIENSKNDKIYISKCIIFMSISNMNSEIGFNDIKNDNNIFSKVLYTIDFDLTGTKN